MCPNFLGCKIEISMMKWNYLIYENYLVRSLLDPVCGRKYYWRNIIIEMIHARDDSLPLQPNSSIWIDLFWTFERAFVWEFWFMRIAYEQRMVRKQMFFIQNIESSSTINIVPNLSPLRDGSNDILGMNNEASREIIFNTAFYRWLTAILTLDSWHFSVWE